MNPLKQLSFWLDTFKLFFNRKGSDAVIILSFTTLLSIVPVLAVVISVFAKTNIFENLSNRVLNQLFEYIVPSSITNAQDYLLQFSQQASQLKGVGILFVLITTMMLLRTVDQRINLFWDNQHTRRWWLSLAHYLGVALFGPLLLAASIALSSYLSALPLVNLFKNIEVINGFSFLAIVPFFLNWLGFSFLYRYVPLAKVHWQSAFIGGLLAAICLELLKLGFSLYLKWFPTYDLIYGVFAAIPIFLLWIYLNWFVVLFNAAIVSQLERYRTEQLVE